MLLPFDENLSKLSHIPNVVIMSHLWYRVIVRPSALLLFRMKQSYTFTLWQNPEKRRISSLNNVTQMAAETVTRLTRAHQLLREEKRRWTELRETWWRYSLITLQKQSRWHGRVALFCLASCLTCCPTEFRLHTPWGGNRKKKKIRKNKSLFHSFFPPGHRAFIFSWPWPCGRTMRAEVSTKQDID